MADRTARLEELRKIVGDSSIAALEKRTGLNLNLKNLTSVPLGVWDLTGLVVLWLCVNRLSSLPPEISRLTGLAELQVQGNPIEELPPQITALTKLKNLYIESSGKISIKRAPRGITNLPCWNITGGDYEHIRKLQLYDPVPPTNPQPNPTLIPPITTPPIVSTPTTPASPSAPAQPPSDPNSAPVTGDYADVMAVDFFSQPILGKGGFGTAYKVQLQKGIVAVKVLKADAKPGTADYDELTKEARMMKDLRHENIIGLYAYGCKSLKVFYVMEYADGKSIWDIIEADGALPLDKSLLYSIHINAGLKYLHSQTPPVEHRDLKPENVLICKGVAKICDFGISSARLTVSRTTSFGGTFHYAPPEAFDAMKGYGPMSDIYTFALVIWAMLAGKRPYDSMTQAQIMSQKVQQKLPEVPPTTPAKLVALMNECWNYDPRQRPTAEANEPRLADIQKNPGAAVGEKGKSVKDMNTAELVAYLGGKKTLPDFIAVIDAKKYTGEDFVELEEKDVTSAPFGLKRVQARAIVDLINEAKAT